MDINKLIKELQKYKKSEITEVYITANINENLEKLNIDSVSADVGFINIKSKSNDEVKDNDKRYELTTNSIEYKGKTLYQIRALKDFEMGYLKIHKNDLGGYVESENNLSQDGYCWIFEEAKVFGNAKVMDNAQVTNRAVVFDNAVICENAFVSVQAKVYGNAKIGGNAWIHGRSQVFGNAVISNNVVVRSYSKIGGNVKVCDNSKIHGSIDVSGDVIISGNTSINKKCKITNDSELELVKSL